MCNQGVTVELASIEVRTGSVKESARVADKPRPQLLVYDSRSWASIINTSGMLLVRVIDDHFFLTRNIY
jgi:hypothetical protein